MSEWTEVKISVAADNVDRAGDIASMVVPYGIYIEDYRELEKDAWEIAHIDLIDEELLKKDRSVGIVHIYISPEENPLEAVAFLRERYAAEGIDSEIVTNQCRNEDWENNWKQYFHPIPVGEKLLIRPTWEDEYDAGGRAVLNIEPGLLSARVRMRRRDFALKRLKSTSQRTRTCLTSAAAAVFCQSLLCFWARGAQRALTLTRLR